MRWLFEMSDLEHQIETQERIAVYGAGHFGKMLVDLIFSIGRQDKLERIIVTDTEGNDHSYRGISIEQASRSLGAGKAFVIVAVSEVHRAEIETIVRGYDVPYCCLTAQFCQEMDRNSNGDDRKKAAYTHLDLLIPGFFKCGTTSVYQAFRTIDEIYLPGKKETLFFEWCDKVESPKDHLIRSFFDDIREGQQIGMIEPTFFREAERVHQIWGSDLKLIFLVRDPVDALFSQFKMCSRQGSDTLEEGYQRRGGVFSGEIFDEWTGFESYFEYADWIEEYERYYPREQIKIVVFEELIQQPRKILDEVLRFIGVSARYQSDRLPWGNEGDHVMADIEGLRLMREYQRLAHEFHYHIGGDPEVRSEKYDAWRRIGNLAKGAAKIQGVTLTEGQRRKMQDHYRDSVRRLERIADRDLSKVWF